MFTSERNEVGARIDAHPRRPIERIGGVALINVTMEDTAVVVRPIGRLDAETVATITQLLASAEAAGTAATLDVSGVDVRDRLIAEDLLATTGQIKPASVA